MVIRPGVTQLPLFGAGARSEPAAPVVAPLSAPTASTSLALAITAFDQHLGRLAKTENTRRSFASDLGILARFLGQDHPVGSITSDDLRRFLTWLQEGRASACSPKTYARRVTTLKVFFAWLMDAGTRADDPALGLVHRRAEPPLPLVLDDSAVADLLGVAADRALHDPRPALLVRLLLDAALKKGELVALRADDVAPRAEPPSLLVRYDDPRWRQKERRVTFGPAVEPLLEAYLNRYRPAERLFQCTARNLEYVLTDLAAAAGLPERTSFETLRWTSALWQQRAGVAPEELRANLGLAPVTWADTEQKLALLAGGAGAPGPQPRWIPVPA
jgi:integrase/recombinase XerD